MAIVAEKPWRVTSVRVDGVTVRGAAVPDRGELGLRVAKVNWALDNASHIAQAIAALPELTAALHDILLELDRCAHKEASPYLPQHLIDQARAALLKAGGPL